MTPLAFIVLRTEGSNPACDDLLEVAVATAEPFDAQAIDVYTARVRSTRDRKPDDGVWLVDAMDQLREMTRGCVLAAWDAGATRTFLEGSCHAWELLPLELAPHVVDLRSAAWPFVVAGGSVSADLTHVADALGVASTEPTCALDEARVLAGVYREIVGRAERHVRDTGLSTDERAIVELLRRRLDDGRRQYGPWRVDDGRDNPREALAEVIDALHYCAAELVRLSKGGAS
ncbi:MAG: hypothetical protein IT379_08450 [Deltaproteobacteria bacterium]|nr:hypothetical protein [Deltaproteobacteria bacterium]